MALTSNNIGAILNRMGFKLCNTGHKSSYSKSYSQHRCQITVDIKNKSISYPTEMKVHDKTTSNFSHEENFVVLECVNRLLEKGYPPSKIELEKNWRVGRAQKGKLDILVREANGRNPYLMIECKTFQKEYDSEISNMLAEKTAGGQLFSYWNQDRDTKYLCLYSSRLDDKGNIEYKNGIIAITNEIKRASSAKSAYHLWNKQFLPNGIFDSNVQPWNVIAKPLLRRNLKRLQKEDGNRIYLHFLEVLRQSVISDKGNAFNKIFNLFLCKIVDEDRNADDELKFQWKEGHDDNESVIGRLNELFKKGMEQYLNKTVTDYSLEDLEGLGLKQTPDKIAQIITELRLYKNQEFAFVDVYNEETFNENAKVVIEMVKLLQGWQIRYTHKQQFLGEFFELLLNSGFKQESGQFFTPVPLVRFIIQSLPISEIIAEKIKNGDTDFLPTVIDFACGSGHFLTESMDIIQERIESLDSKKLKPGQKKRHEGYLADQFAWASDFIFGIEKDYRLAKTSKLSSFLNGDGEATVVHGSGIDPLYSDCYTGKLRAKKGARENPVFDILVANPPYAVKSFKSTVSNGEKQFSLFKKLTEKSGEIEVLFIERMTQIVKPGGAVGIVLPRSFLNNGGIYELARQLLLRHFSIRGITILGGNAFMCTGINTVILFLRKRNNELPELSNDEVEEIGEEAFVLVDTTKGGGDAEKQFLGYDLSGRKGSEGISLRKDFFLFNDEDLLSRDYVNSYICRSMLGMPVPNPTNRLAKNVSELHLKEVIEGNDGDKLSTAINLDLYRIVHDKVELAPMIEQIQKPAAGKSPKGGRKRILQGIVSIGGEQIDEDTGEISLEKKRYVSIDDYTRIPSSHVRNGDILICKDGARTGKSALFQSINEDCCVNEHVFIVRVSGVQVSPQYLFFFIFSTFFRRQVSKCAFNKKGQAGLNQQHFRKILIPLFDKKEQASIVSTVQATWQSALKKGDRQKLVDDVFAKAGLSSTE